jgi:hypothetical protein
MKARSFSDDLGGLPAASEVSCVVPHPFCAASPASPRLS